MMRWMLTANGNEVDLDLPHVSSIMLGDIAHHLAQIPRFTGACRRPYTVAEHSLLVAQIMEREFAQTEPAALFAALMHDAHEAYVHDLATPAKAVAGDGYRLMEARMQRVVRSAFALHTHSTQYAAWIKQADLLALATERAQLMPAGGPSWEPIMHLQPLRWVDLMSEERQAARWSDWARRFADEATLLDYGRDGRHEVCTP